ncbi:MAG: 4Fe-4S binding protein [Chloroflexota bacterium]|nr:4Fe-4S binding protein [Chloroflexota bacterium]
MADQIWMPRIEQVVCNGCGACITECPTGALGRAEGKAALLRPDACIYCAKCESLCPVNAIELPYLIVKIDSPQGDARNER